MYRFFYFITLFLFLFFISGCSSNSSSDTSSQSSSFSISRAPIADGTLVSTLQMLSLEFSVPIDPNSITSSSVYIFEVLTANQVACELTVDDTNTKVTIKPYLYLKPSTTYTFLVTTAVKSAEGQSLSVPYTYTFTTANDSTDDGTNITFKNIKPSDGQFEITIHSDISIQFSKNIAPVADPAGIISVESTGAGIPVDGTIEFFNDIITFKPSSPLTAYVDYTVSLDGSKVTDMYGNSFSGATTSWSFQTVMTDYAVSDGYTSLASLNLGKNSKKLIGFTDQLANSCILVVNDTSIDVVEVGMLNNRPTLTLKDSYDVGETIYGSTMTDQTIFLATESKTYILDFAEDSQIYPNSTPSLPIAGKIYDLIVDGYLYAVGPEYGFKIYDGAGTLVKNVDTTGMVPISIKLSKSGLPTTVGVHVADYKGGVYNYDVNGTYLSTTDLGLGSTRDLAIVPTAGSIEDYLLYVSNSIGKVNFLNFDGSINTTEFTFPIELASSANGVSIINGEVPQLYINNRDKGLMVINNNSDVIGYLTTTNGIAYIDKSHLTVDYNVIATVSSNGVLNIFNAESDTNGPFFTPSEIDAQTFVFNFDDILDVDSFSQNDFIVTDGSSNPISFDMSISVGTYDTNVTIIFPTSCNTLGCNVETTSNIKDIVGNSHTPDSYFHSAV